MEVRSEQIIGGQSIDVGPGNFLMLLDTTASVTVELIKNGHVFEKAVNVEASYKARPRLGEKLSVWYFDKAKISSTTTQTVKFGISEGEGDYGRLVGVVDAAPRLTQLASAPIGYDALAANGFCFEGAGQCVGVVAQFSHVQLLNPAASGKVLFVDGLELSAAVAGPTAISLRYHNVALANLDGNALSKNAGSAASAAQVRNAANAAALGGVPWRYVTVADGASKAVRFDRPVRLEAGEGIIIHVPTVNVTATCSFDFREYA